MDQLPQNVQKFGELLIAEKRVFWATDNYADNGAGYGFLDTINDVTKIVTRVEKSLEEQRVRVKEKAEVFTPSWICNQQNNLVDDSVLYAGAFNVSSEDGKSWVPSSGHVDFGDYPGGWVAYVRDRRIEFACGEAPYLMTRYDAVSGNVIPVRDEAGLYQRVGVLDRKLRVVSENSDVDYWVSYALLALSNTFGYEWQGDNLLLARLNFVNTFVEYYEDFFGVAPDDDLVAVVAGIASWNLWQMDGLKMVRPLSCTEKCVSCSRKRFAGHNGDLAVFRHVNIIDDSGLIISDIDYEYLTFESLYV